MIGGAKLLVDLVGFVYPAYMSFKSMDTNSGDDTQWLTYWICFSAMSITETMLSVVTALIPMYFWIKIAIIVVRDFSFFEICCQVVYRMKICWIIMVVGSYGLSPISILAISAFLFLLRAHIQRNRQWMWYPTTRGAQTIYDQLLRPLLLPYLEVANAKKE
jgi:hypothetical protein